MSQIPGPEFPVRHGQGPDIEEDQRTQEENQRIQHHEHVRKYENPPGLQKYFPNLKNGVTENESAEIPVRAQVLPARKQDHEGKEKAYRYGDDERKGVCRDARGRGIHGQRVLEKP